jgi:hypothetical protein
MLQKLEELMYAMSLDLSSYAFNRDPRTPMQTHVGPHFLTYREILFWRGTAALVVIYSNFVVDNDNNADNGIPPVENPSIVTY